MGKHSIPIWFFIGSLLTMYGLLILGSGIYELFHLPAKPVELFHLHASIWWGAILALLGAGYCIYFTPGKGRG